MQIELIGYSRPSSGGNPMEIVERAACMCYDSEPTPDYRIAKACAKSGHLSVYEHVSFTFKITGVSRALLAQLSRHRHASMSVRSQRYCVEDGFQYVNPFEGEGNHLESLTEWAVSEDADIYKELIGCGAKPEDARMVLPNACCTSLVITLNARALIEVCHKRLCTRAQKEIRMLFVGMRGAVSWVCPEVAELCVPQCEIHAPYCFCTEHKCCGKHPKLSEVYHASAD